MADCAENVEVSRTTPALSARAGNAEYTGFDVEKTATNGNQWYSKRKQTENRMNSAGSTAVGAGFIVNRCTDVAPTSPSPGVPVLALHLNSVNVSICFDHFAA
jgi:hypothetical protein